MDVLKEILAKKLVIIARGIPTEKIGKCAEAVYAGGARLMESTFDQADPNCVEKNQKCIREIIKSTGEKICVGVGTVLNTEQVNAAFEAGARYIISPNVNEAVIKETKRLGMVSIPGAMTPTEIAAAYDFGADIVKLFPADDLGMHYILNLRGPLGHIPLMATGGVNPDTIPEFLKLGIKAFGTGITVLKPEYVKEENYAKITEAAKAHVRAIENIKEM